MLVRPCHSDHVLFPQNEKMRYVAFIFFELQHFCPRRCGTASQKQECGFAEIPKEETIQAHRSPSESGK